MLSTLIILTSATILWTVTSCDHVVKRTDDSDPMEAVVTRLSEEVSELRARVQVLEGQVGRKAAFRAELPAVTTLTANAPIHFHLVHQTGGGYDPHIGVYTAPYSGWYSFQFQLYPQHNTDVFNIDLFQNNRLVTRSGDSSGSNSVGTTIHVTAGDTMWVQTGKTGSYWQSVHCYFSGALVVPDN